MVNFEDGKLVTPAYLNEDGTITPAIYNGKTPLNAHNLNNMQDIVVSAVEPVGDYRKKVWIQNEDNKKIYIKNDNDVYEEFININNFGILYENSSGTSGTINLSNSVKNYEYTMILYGKSSDNIYQSVTLFNASGKKASLCFSYMVRDDLNQIGGACVLLNDTTITWEKNGGANIYNDTTTIFTNEQTRIYKVIGYNLGG